MPIQSVFPTPVYTSQADPQMYEIIQDELWEVVDQLEFGQNDGWATDTHSLSQGAFEGNVLREYGCNNFLMFLHNCINDYLTGLGCQQERSYTMTQSWFTRTGRGKYAPIHNHGSTDVSGVYYLNTSGKDGNLIFRSPHEPYICNFIYDVITADQELPLKQGLIALFPGLMYHGTRVNETDNDRISLSFNIRFTRLSETWQEMYGSSLENTPPPL
tara:strand:- start:10144 stop:10788 length:645 start_codon:yes stop_codon:yes gene_type:complete